MSGRVRLGGVLLVVIAASLAAAPAAVAARKSRPRPVVGEPLSSVRTTKRMVALTFDDGPDPRWTPAVLRVLAQYGASATFFDVGRRALAHPDLVAQELRQGVKVENHTYTHPHLTSLSAAAIGTELAGGSAALLHLGVPAPLEFRPPFGDWDTRVEGVGRALGYRMVLWDLCLERYVRRYGMKAGVERLVAAVKPGSIILAHDGGIPNRGRTVLALPLLLRQLHAAGYRVVDASTLIAARR
jgi:peptidoglycan/xylan/chitin deacetylase (PgdA/CDA1 family)